MGFRQKLANFLYGRYGNDALGFFMLALMLLCGVLTIFLRGFIVAYYIIYGLETLLLILIFARMLSKNIPARRRENELFLKIGRPFISFFKFQRKKYSDPSHKYFKCPKCKASLRVPKGRGVITVTCAKCGNKFTKKS